MLGRGRRRCLGIVPAAIGLLLGWGVPMTASAEGEHARGWVAPDAAIYLEVLRTPQLVDRALGESFQKALSAIPEYSKYLRSDSYKEAQGVLDGIAGKLDTTWDKGLRDLTAGGIVLAVEGEPGTCARMVLIVTPTDPGGLKRANGGLL